MAAQSTISIVHLGGSLTVLDMIDRAFRIYRRNFLTFFTVMAIVYVPVALVSIPASIYSAQQPLGTAATSLQSLSLLVGYISSALQYAIAYPLVVTTASENLLGNKLTVSEAFQKTRSRFGTVAITYILFGIISIVLLLISYVLVFVLIGLVALVMVGYFATATNFLLVQVATLEEVGPMRAINRAWHLSKQRFWRGLSLTSLLSLMVIVTFISVYSVSLYLIIPIYVLQSTTSITLIALQVVLQSVTSLLVTPLLFIAFTVFYYDARVRLEGLDIAYYLSRHDLPRPNQVPTPKAVGRFFNGQDVLNILGILGGFAGLVAATFGIVFAVATVFSL